MYWYWFETGYIGQCGSDVGGTTVLVLCIGICGGGGGSGGVLALVELVVWVTLVVPLYC